MITNALYVTRLADLQKKYFESQLSFIVPLRLDSSFTVVAYVVALSLFSTFNIQYLAHLCKQ